MSEQTTRITPTKADMQVDLALMLRAIEKDIAWLRVQPWYEGAVFDPKLLAAAYERTASAYRRALYAEARVKELEAEVERLKAAKLALRNAALSYLEVCADMQAGRGSQRSLQTRHQGCLMGLFEAMEKEMGQ